MKTNKLVYYSVQGYENTPIVLINTLENFEALLNDFQVNTIYTWEKVPANAESEGFVNPFKASSERKKTLHFSFFHNGLLHLANAFNYKNLNDYKAGKAKGFENGNLYYAACVEQGFETKAEYDTCLQAGFEPTQRPLFLEAQKQNFIGTVAKLQVDYANGLLPTEEYKKVRHLKTDAQVFDFAKKMEYVNYQQFVKALVSGFSQTTATVYTDALNKGFDNQQAYLEAQKGNFENNSEFADAQKIGIANKEEYSHYTVLTNIKEIYALHTTEQANLLLVMSNLDKNEKKSVSCVLQALRENQKVWAEKLNKLSASSISKILGGNTQRMPEWYSSNFKDEVDVKLFFETYPEIIALIGEYYPTGEVFERNANALPLQPVAVPPAPKAKVAPKKNANKKAINEEVNVVTKTEEVVQKNMAVLPDLNDFKDIYNDGKEHFGELVKDIAEYGKKVLSKDKEV